MLRCNIELADRGAARAVRGIGITALLNPKASPAMA